MVRHHSGKHVYSRHNVPPRQEDSETDSDNEKQESSILSKRKYARLEPRRQARDNRLTSIRPLKDGQSSCVTDSSQKRNLSPSTYTQAASEGHNILSNIEKETPTDHCGPTSCHPETEISGDGTSDDFNAHDTGPGNFGVAGNDDVNANNEDIAYDDHDDSAERHPDAQDDSSISSSDDESSFYGDISNDSDRETLETNNCDNSEEAYLSSALFEGCPVDTKTGLILIVQLITRFKLPSVVVSALLELYALFCPGWHLSVHKLYKFLQDYKYTPEKHFYCSKCQFRITDPDNTRACPVPGCGSHLRRDDDSLSYFWRLPLVPQAKELCSRKEIIEYIFGDKRSPPTNDGTIRDITDGQVYREFKQDQGETWKETFTLTWNTDGVSVFKSSRCSIWPFYLCINELPPHLRFRKENLLLGGLFWGKKKPLMLTFLQPIVEDLRSLENGFDMDIATDDQTNLVTRVKGFLLAGTADLPAKAMVLNMVQFNGAYSCIKCLHSGESFATGNKNGTVHVYRNTVSEKRTQQMIVNDGRKAVESGKPFKGMKGIPLFNRLRFYRLRDSSSVDVMHGIYLGLVLKMLSILTDKHHAHGMAKDAYDQLNARVVALKPPHIVKRAPRHFDELSHYKASELCAMLLLYVPIFYGLLDTEVLDHLMCLSHAMFLLSQTKISNEELCYADRLLQLFSNNFENIYGLRYQTTNFHNLQHLVEEVRNLGPCWNFDCFPYEDASGHLVKLIHGTRHVDSQLIRAVAICQKLPSMIHSCDTLGDLMGHKVVQSLMGMPSKRGKKVAEQIYMLGVPNDCVNDPQYDFAHLVGTYFGALPANLHVQRYLRVHKHGVDYHSRKYERVCKRNSYTVQYENGDYGIVEEYFLITIQDVEYSFALMRKLECIADRLGVASHIKVVRKPKYERNENLLLVPIEDIKCLCVYIDMADMREEDFVVDIPYTFMMR